MTGSYEAIVIGAGPAGCAAAALLSRWGHRVLLLDSPGPHDRGLAVSIPPSARRTLQAVGFLSAMEAAGFQPWRGNSVWWADAAPRVERFPSGIAGFHAVRSDLHRVALSIAREAGADVRAARARAVRFGELQAAPPSVQMETTRGTSRVRAALVLDCSGRSGVVARGGLRVFDTSVRTVALTGIWRSSSALAEFDATHTLVASYTDGWAWSIPTAPGVRYVTVMVDPRRTSLDRTDSAPVTYRRELTKVGPFAALLEEATLAEGPWGHDASLYSARQYAGPGYLLVGDAGSFIDPLSSFGVKKALASAWVAAVAAHTALARPPLRAEALAFHDCRERQVHARYRRDAARFASSVAAHTPHPFWTARASPADDRDEDGVDELDLARDAGVQAALEDLRRRETLRLQPGNVETIRRPAIVGHEIELVDHFVVTDRPDGVRYLHGVDLAALAALAPRHTSVGDLLDTFTREHAAVSMPAVLAALSFLIDRGVLVHAAGTGPSRPTSQPT